MKKSFNKPRPGFFDMNSKEFHKEVFDLESEMDDFLDENPQAEGYEIFDKFCSLLDRKKLGAKE